MLQKSRRDPVACHEEIRSRRKIPKLKPSKLLSTRVTARTAREKTVIRTLRVIIPVNRAMTNIARANRKETFVKSSATAPLIVSKGFLVASVKANVQPMLVLAFWHAESAILICATPVLMET